jgi:phage gp46-like protein
MPDIISRWTPDFLVLGSADWQFDGRDLESGQDLETATIISLFTDRLAHPDDALPDPQDGDRRGWWADWDSGVGNIGSRLWLINREKQTEAVRLRVEDYCREALAWMLEDDVADSVQVAAQWNPRAPGRLDVDVVISRARAVLLHRSFSWAWQQAFPMAA